MGIVSNLAIIVIPSLIVFLTAYFILKSYLENDREKRELELKSDQRRVSIPLRLQAYERLALFLERISPDNMIMRLNAPNLSAAALQNTLISTIRMEYEHNMAQQIYISNDAWNLIKNAKEDVIRIINTAYSKMNENSTSIDLSTVIFEEFLRTNDSAINKALIFLKNEGRKILD